MTSSELIATTTSAPEQASDSTPMQRRAIAGAVLVPCVTLLGVAAWLEPSPTGMGTHEALGLPPCNWVLAADIPCPTCGMTTAFSHAANGDLMQSFFTQPLGCILALLTAMITLVSMHVVFTGSRIGGALSRLFTRHVAWALAVSVVAAWVYTIIRHRSGV